MESNNLYTTEEILNKTKLNLSWSIEDKRREIISLQGEITALEVTLTNIKCWESAKKS